MANDSLPFGKDARPDYPETPKRQGFTARQVAAVFIKCDGRCTKCGLKVQLDGYQIDHIHRISAGGKHELENWQLLCTDCHAVKTRVDNFEAKKGRRIRGELKPRAKKKIPQPVNYSWPSRKMERPGLRRKMNGQVERT